MKVALYGRNLDELKKIITKFPFEIVEKDPEVIISHGGDGALLGAEYHFPGIAKCPIRDDFHNPKCAQHSIETTLEKLLKNELKVTISERLQATVENVFPQPHIVALNDICINKANITSAVRIRLSINDIIEYNQIIGDGLIVSTIFGSTGYYRSITKSLFRVGIGIAFNNSTEPLDHLVIPDDSIITVEILRGPAVLLGDNHSQRIPVKIGSKIKIQKNPLQTAILGLDIFRCQECLKQRSNGNHLYYLSSNSSEY